MFFKRMLISIVLVVFSLSMFIYAQDTVEVEPILYIGTITDEPDIFVGLSIEADNVTLYICDGQADKNTISIGQWFIGTMVDNAIDITAGNGNRVEVTVNEAKASGKFTFANETVKEFTLELADGSASLFRSDFAIGDDEYVGGWLVLEDGSVRGSVFVKGTEKLVPATLVGKKEIVDGSSNT